MVDTWPSENVVSYELLDLVMVSTAPPFRVAKYMNAPGSDVVCELAVLLE